ncbi:MAG: argininosuccinate synthase [Clostridiales Family XIII bacterium]|nr:argininosuccinate synthase [Clostridiales Family XIII bacterium]
MSEQKEKIVLAYSGGLDTSIILTWLKEEYNAEIITVCADVGQDDDFSDVDKKAYATGATKAYTLDLKDEFVEDYIWPTLKSGAVYENDYLLGTSMARPLIAEKLVDIAHKEGAHIIAHGATGKGNDQVRFESTIHALDPSIKILAPWRIWNLRSREQLIDYAASHGIPIEQTREKIYSRDQNIWHISHESGNLEDPWNEHLEDIHVMSVPVEKGPDEPAYVNIDFEAGVPVALDGEKLSGVALIQKLNKLGGEHGVGTIDIVENRLVGMKSRGVYETPGGTILLKALQAIEKLVLDRDSMNYKNQVALKYAQLVYDGLWFTPLREAFDAFVNVLMAGATGTVRMKLYKGNALPVASKSEYSLFNEEFATMGEDEVYNQKDAEGFINLFSLSMKIRAIQKAKREGK